MTHPLGAEAWLYTPDTAVYFVGPERFDGGGEPMTHAGRVREILSTRPTGLFAVVELSWTQTDTGSETVERPVSDLFTAGQVKEIIGADGGPLSHDWRHPDELCLDLATNFQLTKLLAAVLLQQPQHPRLDPNASDG